MRRTFWTFYEPKVPLNPNLRSLIVTRCRNATSSNGVRNPVRMRISNPMYNADYQMMTSEPRHQEQQRIASDAEGMYSA